METILKFTDEEKQKVESLQSMIQSCFAYGGADKESYNFERWIKPYLDKLNPLIFWTVYNDKLNDLKENYTVEYGVYTDFEGCTYNQLVKK